NPGREAKLKGRDVRASASGRRRRAGPRWGGERSRVVGRDALRARTEIRRDQTAGDPIMIEMSCPRCRAGGRVPREKGNSRLVCKKCLQVFHLSPSLQPVVGEPPAPKVAAKERVQRERVEIEIPGLEGLGEKLGKLKLPEPKVIAVTAGVLLAIAFFWWL